MVFCLFLNLGVGEVLNSRRTRTEKSLDKDVKLPCEERDSALVPLPESVAVGRVVHSQSLAITP